MKISTICITFLLLIGCNANPSEKASEVASDKIEESNKGKKSGGKNDANSAFSLFPRAYALVADAGDCDEEREGLLVYAKTDKSFYVCEAGSWEIIDLRGPKGDKGDKGEAGLSGEPGLKGEKGDKGDTGDTGPTGSAGATGAQGPQGLQGVAGAIGPAGSDGIDGNNGSFVGGVLKTAEGVIVGTVMDVVTYDSDYSYNSTNAIRWAHLIRVKNTSGESALYGIGSDVSIYIGSNYGYFKGYFALESELLKTKQLGKAAPVAFVDKYYSSATCTGDYQIATEPPIATIFGNEEIWFNYVSDQEIHYDCENKVSYSYGSRRYLTGAGLQCGSSGTIDVCTQTIRTSVMPDVVSAGWYIEP